jgi:glycosyltransferase involved in cell wall biosynthesis
MQPKGGSELAYQALLKNVGSDWVKVVNLILSVCNPALLDTTRKNVVWQQLSYDQQNVALVRDKSFVDRVDCFVYVSNWQYEKFRNIYNIPEYKSVVIKNATEPFIYTQRSQGKMKLIYTSAPNRGLDVLLDAFEVLSRDDVELDVYSSTIIYGSDYSKQVDHVFKPLFDRASNMKNVNYKGYGENSVVREALQQSHIFAYPSTFEETSCMAAIEAGSAGCKLITTNYGALYETGSEYATMVPFNSNRSMLVRSYAKALNQVINNYWKQENLDLLQKQSVYFNTFYNWQVRTSQWKNLFNHIIKNK